LSGSERPVGIAVAERHRLLPEPRRGIRFVSAVLRAPGPRICGSISAEVVMLPSLSRGLRLALVLALSAGYITWHGHVRLAEAAPKGGGDDDEGGDDDDSGPKDEGDDATAEDDKDQPPVTAGGLFTMKTYPLSELLRPLTITQNITQARLAVGTDLSSLGAFSSLGLSLEGEYGVSDNFMVIGGFTSAYNFAQLGVYGGFEGSLIYDLVDIRLAANVHRFASPHLCGDPRDGTPPDACKNPMDMTMFLPLPNGKYDAGKSQFSLDLGFPFRYDVKPEFAVIALQTLMSINFNAVAGNKATPDLLPSVGIATNPIPALSLVVFAQLRVVDFNTDAGNFQVPVTGRVEFSPNQQLDIGLEFTLLNIKPPDPQKPFDNRFLSLFVQSRFGK
jgi:hypothetical protein